MVAVASIPEEIRGYGHVKEKHLLAAQAKETSLMAALEAGDNKPDGRHAA